MTELERKEDNPIYDRMETAVQLMFLNVMWFVCSLPILTIGASTAALNYTCIKMRRDEGDSIVKMFFRSFAQNIRQGLILGTGMLAVLIILSACLIQVLGMINAGHGIGVLFAVALVILLFLWLVLFAYLFMVLARFDNSIFRTLTNAVYFMISDWFRTFRVFGFEFFGMIAVPYLLWRFIPALFPLVLFFGIPSVAYLTAKIFNEEIFSDFVPEPSK